MRILVTGATGFIGFHVARRLRASGHEVAALVRDAEKATRVLAPIGVGVDDCIIGDMTDETAVGRALEGCRGVVHAAATVAIGSGDPNEMLRGNVRGTELVIGGALDREFGAVVYVSSMTALFDSRHPTITLDSPIAESRSPYGRSKAACERIVQGLLDAGAALSVVYPGGVIGPDDPGMSESVYSYRGFTRQLLATTGGVSQIDVRDLAGLLTGLIEHQHTGRVLAPGHYLSWIELGRVIEEVTGASPGRIKMPAPMLRTLGRVADVINSVRGTSSQFSREGMTIATLLPRTENSPEVMSLGPGLRPASETLSDMYRWLLSIGKLPERAVPKLASR
jgi:nucleoside-diphosphate-sugar epimerase